MRIELSRFVEDDLDAIAAYVAEDNPVRALSFIREIRAKFHLIGQRPSAYRLRPEIASDARMALIRRYAILFRIRDRSVRIERVLYAGRNLRRLFPKQR
jgi:plasmid stabilization system protein ParE